MIEYSYVMPGPLPEERLRRQMAAYKKAKSDAFWSEVGEWANLFRPLVKCVGWVLVAAVMLSLGLLCASALISALSGPLTGGSLLLALWLFGAFDRGK